MNRTPGLPCPREGVSVSCPVKKEAGDNPKGLRAGKEDRCERNPGGVSFVLNYKFQVRKTHHLIDKLRGRLRFYGVCPCSASSFMRTGFAAPVPLSGGMRQFTAGLQTSVCTTCTPMARSSSSGCRGVPASVTSRSSRSAAQTL